MTLADLLHRPVRRGRIISNVAVIVLPAEVRTNMFHIDRHGGRLEVHNLGGDGMNTRCGISLSLPQLDIIATAVIIRRCPWWCGGCWPTDRYCHCGAPSGQDTVCSLCGAVGQAADDRIEAAP